MRAVLTWLDNRTGYRRLLVPIGRRVVPKGPGWWRTTASCLLWLLIVQVITGGLLMTTYSPSANSAWASVHYIESSAGGSFIRGLHYFAAQAMIILFGIHIVRVLLAGAFRAPRELIWISGLILAPLMLLWAITGNPLSGTREGFAQIDVEGHILGSTPVVGPFLRDLLIGGDQPGNLTLTHLYFLHGVPQVSRQGRVRLRTGPDGLWIERLAARNNRQSPKRAVLSQGSQRPNAGLRRVSHRVPSESPFATRAEPDRQMAVGRVAGAADETWIDRHARRSRRPPAASAASAPGTVSG